MKNKKVNQLAVKVDTLMQLLVPPNPNTINEDWLDSADIKQQFHFSDSKLYRLRKANAIPHRKLGGTYVYPKYFFTKILMESILKAQHRTPPQ